MSDEIDIEEHDVMDNPSIKRIFPDLSVIKKEINQYYDEVLNTPTGTTVEESSQEQAITGDPKTPLHTQIHNGNACVATSPCVPEATETQNPVKYMPLENIIILGSKPNIECKKHDSNSIKKEPKIILKDLNIFLNRCKRYCKECLILFPKPDLLKLHIHNIHTKKYSLSMFMGKKIANKTYKCNICDRCLSSSTNLIRHFRNLHGDVKTINTVGPCAKETVSNKTSEGRKTSKSDVFTGLPCFHCQQLFSTQSSLIEHLYEVLEPSKFGTSDRFTSLTCAKEIYKEDNDKSDEEESYKDSNDSNLSHMDDLLPNSELDSNKGNYDNISPQKYDAKRVLSNSSVGSAERDEECAIKKKRVTDSNLLRKGHTKDRIRLTTKKCNECMNQFNSEKELEYHIQSVHRRNKGSSNKNKGKLKVQKKTKKITSFKKPTRPMFYKCFICSKYNVTFKFYARHITTDHNIKKVIEGKKVPFHSQCKFCPSKPQDIKAYNVHLYKYHHNILKQVHCPRQEQEVIKNQEKINKKIRFALKSTLFKCMKCDLYFLSSNSAMSHSKHIGMINTWECLVCQRIFKREDMALHKKQHSFSQTFTEQALSESAFTRVLYKCSNCTVHYSEDNFLLHFLKCESETPNSLYCKNCDILINRDDMDSHALNHKDKTMENLDFIIIESDMIDDRPISSTKAKTKNKTVNRYAAKAESLSEDSKLVMHFCHTCDCFISNINFTRNVHIEGRCGHMLKTVCKECGLVLTMKTHATHKQHHRKKEIKLHDYLFFDLKSKRRIRPPIPTYPKCTMCGVHFLRNFAIKIHSCQEQDYITCSICSIKLTEHAYKLHMPFHNYSVRNVKKDTILETDPESDVSYVEPNLPVSEHSYFTDVMIFYTCKSCQLTVNTYDKVVQHCQDHYDSKVVQLSTQKCQNCTFVLDKTDYKTHDMLHLNGKYNKDLLEVVDFDPFYFRFDNIFWSKHIFAYVADEKISNILNASIYRFESRLKMEEVQSGSSSLVLYKCDKCQVFIEPHSLYTHAKISLDRCCVKWRKTHPCAFCGLCFFSVTFRNAHEEDHKNIGVNLKSYKIILYNKAEHRTYNKIMYDASYRYILYQCRNCERVVDKFERVTHSCDVHNLKLCSTCGLLFHKEDFDLHFIRHEELDTFNAENIIVVMFGKVCYLGNKESRSTFSGTKYDYTIYKCNKCDLCLRTKKYTSEHSCIFDNSKFKCSKCGLYFSKQELNYHSKLHESNLEFDDLNINIVTFDTSADVHLDPKEKLVENNNIPQQTEEENEKNNLVIENTSNPTNVETIYKCDCGLHFLEESNAQQHANNCNIRMKISKQSCIKCDLLFTPGELFNHLLKHHCDKKLQFKFDIVMVHNKEKNS